MEFKCTICNNELTSAYQVSKSTCSPLCSIKLYIQKNAQDSDGCKTVKSKTYHYDHHNHSIRRLLMREAFPEKMKTVPYVKDSCGNPFCINMHHLLLSKTRYDMPSKDPKPKPKHKNSNETVALMELQLQQYEERIKQVETWVRKQIMELKKSIEDKPKGWFS